MWFNNLQLHQGRDFMNRWTMFFIPVITLITNAFATDVGGIISVNTVWTAANSPYIVKSNLLLEAGAELIIEPGVEVKFDQGIGFWIRGILNAVGTSNDWITFTSNSQTPQNNDWKGIVFDGINSYVADEEGGYISGSIICCGIIQFAEGITDPSSSRTPAILVKNSSAYLENLIIRHCRYMGLLYFIVPQTSCLFRNCQFTDISEWGFVLENDGKVKILSCNFSYNLIGLLLITEYLQNSLTEIDSCTFNDNNNEGIIVAHTLNANVNITNCNFFNNKTGIYFESEYPSDNSHLLKLLSSAIYHNDVGINLIGSHAHNCQISYCSIYGNNTYQVKTQSKNYQSNIDATNNWWGTTNETLIESGIYDYYDDFSYAKIVYKPYLLGPISSYTLTVNAINGSVTKNPDQVSYNAGSSVILTATPSPGYSFTSWSGDASGSTNPLTIPMDANKTITANFELDQSNPSVKINLKAILQGCYNANLDQMSTLLNAGSYIPHTSPYCEDQCSVGYIPIDVTDWVLVQLFNIVSDAPLVSKSAFLRRDGYLVDTDGNIGINVEARLGNYFVGLVHRNHLTVMTSSAITLSTNEGILYDFTTGADKCYGGNGSVEVEPGIWGMWSGDINHDGLVTTRDYKIWFESERACSAGYLYCDVNLDGLVDDLDYSMWLSNSQKGATSSHKRIGDESGICLSTDSLNFGAVSVDDEIEKTFYINNTGSGTLQIISINIDNTSFSVVGSSNFNIEAGAYQGVKVRFTPASPVLYTAVLQINNNSADGVKEVTLTGTGSEFGTVTDIDGNIYKTVKIGNQWWMAENLKVTHYRNGDDIPFISLNGTWTKLAVTDAYCYYGNDLEIVPSFGMLYSGYAVIDNRKIAPIVWHVATDEEWKEMEIYLGMSISDADDTGWRGDNEGGKLKEVGTAHWFSPNTDATNESGFSALPGGCRYGSDGDYHWLGDSACFWSCTICYDDLLWTRKLGYLNSTIERYGQSMKDGRSVRCVKD